MDEAEMKKLENKYNKASSDYVFRIKLLKDDLEAEVKKLNFVNRLLKDKPRRPVGPYFRFVQYMRKNPPPDFPTIFEEIAKFCGARWMQLSEEEKQVFI